MSHYTFRIWFTGLMHFVENKDPYAKCQLCVVLPRAQDEDRRKHKGAIYEVSRETYCGKLRLRPGSTIGPHPNYYLDRHRIAFRVTRTDDIQPEPTASLSFPYGFLHLPDIAGIFADENDQIVSLRPPDAVLAQILVEVGFRFDYDKDSVTRWWDIPPTLTGYDPFCLELADPVFVEIDNVEKVEILFYKMDEQNTLEYCRVLTPGGNGFIEILAANTCRDEDGEECLLGLDDLDFQWLDGGRHLQIRQLDRDFEYHYRLLHPATLEAIKKVLPKKHGVIPEEPRFPVPESPLVDIKVAPHICLEDFLRPKPGPETGPHEAKHGNEESTEERANEIAKLWFPSGEAEFLKLLTGLLIVILGTGTGSGNDCLSTKAQARFVDLDGFIPAPQPAVSMSVLRNRAALDRRVSFQAPGAAGYPFAEKQEEPITETPEPQKD